MDVEEPQNGAPADAAAGGVTLPEEADAVPTSPKAASKRAAAASRKPAAGLVKHITDAVKSAATMKRRGGGASKGGKKRRASTDNKRSGFVNKGCVMRLSYRSGCARVANPVLQTAQSVAVEALDRIVKVSLLMLKNRKKSTLSKVDVRRALAFTGHSVYSGKLA